MKHLIPDNYIIFDIINKNDISILKLISKML